jgi:hypothetical protein
VESVAWISERKDVLSTFFGLLSLWAYVRYAQKRSLAESRKSSAGSNKLALGSRPSTFDYCMALFFFALGLMSKPMLVTWPFVLLLLDFWPLRRMTSFSSTAPILRRLIFEKLPFLALAAASSVMTLLVQRTLGATELLGNLPISERIGNALVSCIRYLGKLVWPEHLAFFYPYPGVGIVNSTAWTGWQVAGSAVLLSLITLAALWQVRRRPFLIVGWLWFLGTLVPVIGLVQVGGQAMADRYTYIPLIGIFVMIAWAGKELGGHRPYAKFLRGTVTAAALVACLVLTGRQVRYWRNSETLCRHAIAVTANNYKAHFNLGLALIDEGKTDAGIAQMYEALAIAPGFGGRMQFTDILVQQGRIPEAMEQYRIILQQNPNLPLALNNLAWLLATDEDPKLRNGTEAVRLAERACDLTHYQTMTFISTLAAAYAEAGRFDEAVKTEEMVVARANSTGEKDLLERNRRLLELYRAGHPYHETSKLH